MQARKLGSSLTHGPSDTVVIGLISFPFSCWGGTRDRGDDRPVKL
jgi:hypothetical protein